MYLTSMGCVCAKKFSIKLRKYVQSQTEFINPTFLLH